MTSMSSDTRAGELARRELDLVDLVAIAWTQRLFIILITLLVFIPLAVLAYVSLTPSYTAGSRLLVIMDDEDLTPGAAGTGGEFMFDQIMQSEADLLASEEVRRRMLIELTGAADPQQLKTLGEGFGVSRAPNASFLIATFKNEDADVAANTVNAIVDAYLRYRVELLTGGFEGGVQARLDAAERDAQAAQQALRTFLADNAITDFETELNSALGRLADLQGRKLAADADAAQARALAQALEQRLQDIPQTIELYVENSVTGQLLDLQVRQAELMARYQPDAPPVLAVEREIEALERFVQEGRANGQGQRRTGVNPIWQELESSRLQQESNAAGQERLASSLNAQLRAARTAVERFRALQSEYDRLTRAVSARSAAADQLSVQAADAMARRDMPPGGADAIRIVSRATPPVQAQSNRKLAVMAVGVLAGGIALLLGLIRGYVAAVRQAAPPQRPNPPEPRAPSNERPEAEPAPEPHYQAPRRTPVPVLARVSDAR
ncbi:GumC family protein [Oceanicaulis sp.]|uniref:GumC family protein n=1 Tax=Oceanicaulis sp. TaxID=1924941 RepID=UPI003BAAB25E